MAQVHKSKPRLGRGLSSLISVSDLPVEAEVAITTSSGGEVASNGNEGSAVVTTAGHGQPLQIPIDQIHPNPHQPRKTIADAAVAELSASLKSSGIIQPLIVRRQGDHFELIAGERRWRAAKLAGMATVPAIVRNVDGPTQAQLALIENIQREDLNPIDRAEGYRSLMSQLGLTQAELSGRLGEERSSIANYLRLLDLAEPVRNMVRDGRVTLGHAKLLAGVPDILQQQKLADTVVSQSLSVRNLERLLQADAEPLRPRRPSGSTAHLADLEKSIARQIGMRVQIHSAAKGRGRLVLHYASLDQFDDLLSKLGVKAE
jgi:ParB family transcriptional regulator, chromosome partitioning protein